jgi:hypothetical protein
METMLEKVPQIIYTPIFGTAGIGGIDNQQRTKDNQGRNLTIAALLTH